MRAIQLGLGLSRLELASASTSSSSGGGCMAQGIGWLAGACMATQSLKQFHPSVQ